MDAWLSVLPSPLTLIALVSLALALVFLFGAVLALRRHRLFRTIYRLLLASVFALLVALLAALAVGVQGYRALTHEATAAVVSVEPAGEQHFTAQFLFPDGRKQRFVLTGDQLYVDARIIKWKYWANVLGLHTAYELDRVGGRYRVMDDERSKPRSLESLAPERPVDLFELRKRFEALSPLYDAEYGSATFVPADRPEMYEILVSTTGLLARRVHAASEPVSD